jgi:hypothetical protein
VVDPYGKWMIANRTGRKGSKTPGITGAPTPSNSGQKFQESDKGAKSQLTGKETMLLGDFNEILSCSEKVGGEPADMRRCIRFGKWVQDCGLMDLA